MSVSEETIEATLDPDGHLNLARRPLVSPGPVRVTIQVAAAAGPPRRGLADVVRDIAAGQRSRGFPGRSATEVLAEDEARRAEDDERDRERAVEILP